MSGLAWLEEEKQWTREWLDERFGSAQADRVDVIIETEDLDVRRYRSAREHAARMFGDFCRASYLCAEREVDLLWSYIQRPPNHSAMVEGEVIQTPDGTEGVRLKYRVWRDYHNA